MRIDDDTLVAYLDAQLGSDAEYEAVEDALAASPALRARLQSLAESGELARKAFDAKLEEAVPPQLIAAIMNAPLPQADTGWAGRQPVSAGGANDVEDAAAGAAPRPATPAPSAPGAQSGATARPAAAGLGARLAAWLGQGFGGAAAFASILTLALGALIGHYLLPPPEAGAPLARQGEPIRNAALAVALQAAPSGLAVDLGDARVEIMASFAGRDGRVCREYALSGPASGHEIGIACRDGAAETGWRLAFVAHEPTTAATEGGYGTASDRLHEAVDAFLSEHVDGEPLDAERERTLIERGWSAD